MNRWKAASIHLTISFMLAVSVATLLYFLWFPTPYFVASGASSLILLLIGVDVCIGPLLTLLVVNPRKTRRLVRLDLAVIGLIQAIAFAYGIKVIALARPVFIVAEIDRLVIVSAEQVTDGDLIKGKYLAFRKRSWTGPVFVGALPPKGDKAIGFALEVMRGGKDIDQLPQFYVPYEQVIDPVLSHAKPISALKKLTPSQREQLLGLQTHAAGQSLLALPVVRGSDSYAGIFLPDMKKPSVVVSTDPW